MFGTGGGRHKIKLGEEVRGRIKMREDLNYCFYKTTQNFNEYNRTLNSGILYDILPEWDYNIPGQQRCSCIVDIEINA